MTIESGYEYRVKRLIREFLAENDQKAKDLSPDELLSLLWMDSEKLGELLYEDMVEWMSGDEWLDAVKGL